MQIGLIAVIMRYVFIVFIYLFIYGIIRLIYLDISSMNVSGKKRSAKTPQKEVVNAPYIKLISGRENLGFKVHSNYIINGNILLGRTNRSHIAIPDPYLSAIHAKFINKNGACAIMDMKSTNGTFVNGNRIGSEPVYLKDGDKIKIGQMEFLFVNKR